jgi:hypothetical protein
MESLSGPEGPAELPAAAGSAATIGRAWLTRINGRREAIWFSLAAAEVCWVTPVFLALNQVRNPHPPALLWLGILILMLGFFYFYRALEAANLRLHVRQGLLAAALILGAGLILRFHVYAGVGLRGSDWFLLPFRHLVDVAVVMPSSWVTIFLLVYLWARAIHLANRSPLANSVAFSFRSGVVILIVSSFLAKIFAGLDVAGFVAPYFFFSLLAVALARIEEVSLQPTSSQVPFSSFWIGSMVGAVTVLVILGMSVAVFFYAGGLDQVLRWLYPLLFVLQVMVAGLGALLLMLLEWILSQFSVDLSSWARGLQELFARLGQALALPLPTPPPGSETQTRPLILGILQAAVTIGIPLAAILIVLFLTWRRLRRGRFKGGGNEEWESLLSGKAVANGLQAMVRDGFDRLAELAGSLSHFGLGARFLAALSIRRIYANLVRLATEVGYPRAKAQTPHEYLQTLYQALPGSEVDVDLITAAYVNAHYGQVPDSREELQRIRGCWERVRAMEARKRKKRLA